MSVKICGRKIRWQKPIKICGLVKTLMLLTAVNLAAVTPALAADHSYLFYSTQQASPGVAVPCLPLQKSGMSTIALKDIKAAPSRTQRAAGPSSSMSPAMALALALGVRNISGPMVHTAKREPVKMQTKLIPVFGTAGHALAR